MTPNPLPRQGATSDSRVLVVDDNSSIRKLIKICFEQNGITALDAPSGRDALDILEQHSERIRLLITDLAMPGMSGAELATDVRRLYPNLPIFFISGYSDHPPEPRAGDRWMQKPLDLPRLIDTAMRMLAGETQCVS
jgi:two-component system cell cycle sensor histidine kinase/response regulator CckA